MLVVMSSVSQGPLPESDPPSTLLQEKLTFDEAIPVNGVAESRSCSSCSTILSDLYYVANGNTICSSCADHLGQTKPLPPGAKGLLRAVTFGAGAAALGTIAYFAVLALTGYEIGWIAVGVGWLVGRAVRKGGYGRGGRKLQLIAACLTYCSIVGSYIPLIVKEIATAKETTAAVTTANAPKALTPGATPVSSPAAHPPDVGSVSVAQMLLALLVLFAVSLAAPFLAGLENIVGLFIIFLGLFEAWRINRLPTMDLSGPFSLAAAPEAAASE